MKGLVCVNVGDRIKRLRLQRGWSQRRLASSVGMNNSVLSRIENNLRPVETEELKKFAEAFDVNTDYLSGFDKSNISHDAQDFADFIDLSEDEAIPKIKDAFGYKGKNISEAQARMIYYLALGVVNKD